MDYNKMYCGETELDKMVREMTSQGWKMFIHEHPDNNSTIDIIMSDGTEIKEITFNQKFLYLNGDCVGTCAIARFWK